MYLTNYLGCMKPCNLIAWLIRTQNKHGIMQNFSQNNKWNVGLVHFHVEPPPTPPIKSKHDDKPEKDFVKVKLHRDPTSENLDVYEFKMALFYNGDREDCFVRS